jgi:hypothetical protein
MELASRAKVLKSLEGPPTSFQLCLHFLDRFSYFMILQSQPALPTGRKPFFTSSDLGEELPLAKGSKRF